MPTCVTCGTYYGGRDCPTCLQKKHLEIQSNELKKQTKIQKQLLVEQRVANQPKVQYVAPQSPCPKCSNIISEDCGNCPHCGAYVLPATVMEPRSIISRVIRTIVMCFVILLASIFTGKIFGFSIPWYGNWVLLGICGYYYFNKYGTKPIKKLVSYS